MADAPTALFAYGTLQPGRLRWPWVEPFAVAHQPAKVLDATLYDSLLGWPLARFGDGGPGIPGTLIELDPARLDEALAEIDAVEATATDLLHRIVVETEEGDRAWAYHAPDVPAGAMAIPDWTSTNER